MHKAASEFIAVWADKIGPVGTVVDAGGRDINGSPKVLFGDARYIAVDPIPGPGVDVPVSFEVFADRWTGTADVVVCAEVLEHHPEPFGMFEAAARVLAPGGWLIITCASEGREEHSAIDGGPLRDDEHYRNIPPGDVLAWMRAAGFTGGHFETNLEAGDLYAVGRKPAA